MKTSHTLAHLKKEATLIAENWNGEDSIFNVEGITYTEDQAHAASQLLESLEEIDSLIKELRI